jgi:hypothetical protein
MASNDVSPLAHDSSLDDNLLDLQSLTELPAADPMVAMTETAGNLGVDQDPLADAVPSDASDVGSEPLEDEEGESVMDRLHRPWSMRKAFMGMGAFSISVIVHVILLVVMGLMVLEDATNAAVQTIVSVLEERPEDAPVEVELDKRIEVVDQQTMAVFSTAATLGASGPVSPAAGSVTLDQTIVEKTESNTNITIDAPTIGLPDSMGLIEAVPDGEVKGEPRAIVSDYQQAFDAITQELVWMLDKSPVLVVWVFDQSESMKDDQREIRERIANVYNQLGIVGTSNSDALMTSVVSYGAKYAVHSTKGPTSNREEIVRAIDAVPIDPSGEEMMCQAVGETITRHRQFAARGRQMALILVTDESGNRDNNEQYLEAAIKEAKSANCRIYVLGREAVFGYPYAYMSYQHPQTRRVHWLQIDRGPETAFPEQLQTNGFHRRYDAFSSGFGPYEEARLARETNGVFFMLPSVETNLVAAEKHKYDLEALRPFRPDLRAKREVLTDRDQSPLRMLIWKVISDLNPYNPAVRDIVELRTEFPITPAEFVTEARRNQQKAIVLLKYMAEAEKVLGNGRRMREQEVDPRWQANYDLIFAQLVGYQARIYEYGAALEEFLRKPQTAPPVKGNLRLVHWDIGGQKQLRTEECKPYADRATSLLQAVKDDFPGTPWAARAEYELRRGFGVNIHPDYHEPYVEVPNAMPLPKL